MAADPIIEQELQLCVQVIAAIDRAAGRAGPSESQIVAELERLRDQLASGQGGDDRAAVAAEFSRQSALLAQLRAARAVPRATRDSPYFAHMRLQENGRQWDVCLGKATFVESGVNVVDWRNAPVAKIFYRYRQGEDYDEEIAGRLRCGQVVLRRTVLIRDGRLHRVEAPEGTFEMDPASASGWSRVERATPRLAAGAGAVLREQRTDRAALGLHVAGGSAPRRADKHLPDIAALIDTAQFEVIARPSAGLVVIRGSAGSGKTTVALHRIAFLAYADAAFDSPRTLVVVFSRALRDYVAHVLPALGVGAVRVETFTEWASALRRSLLPMLPAEVRDDAPAVVQRLKQHPLMLTALERQVARNPAPASALQVIDDWGSALGDAALLGQVAAATAPASFARAEIERVSDWCRARHAEIGAWLEGDTTAEAAIEPHDEALLLRAFQLRCGGLRDKGGGRLRYRHIAVDEVQDFSPLEIRLLLDCLDDSRSMTLAGDTQQHVLLDSGFTSWAEFLRQLGMQGTEVDTLRVSYRSTAEIVAFGRAVLGPLAEDDDAPLVTRSGAPVEMFRFADHGACVAFLADALSHLVHSEPLASVVLLTPTAAISELYEHGLRAAEVPRLHRVIEQRYRFAPGIEITEVGEVKGLEFDYVILLEASAQYYPDTAAARRRLHVGATRAIHQLWLTSVATPSPLLPAVG